MRLILTGGGTAGHVYPLLAILEELNRLKGRKAEVLYIGSRGGIEKEILKNKNIPSYFIYSGKWRRYWFSWPLALFSNVFDLFKILVGFFQSLFIVAKFKPEIIIAKGGYVTLPVVLVSWFFKIPVILHESDIVTGVSNKILSKIAKKICVGFASENYPDLPKNKLVFTGNPVRKEFLQARKLNKLNIRGDVTILITGGSRGSRRINQLIYQILPDLLQKARVIHLTGSLDFHEAQRRKEMLAEELKSRYLVYKFLEKGLPKLIKQVDLIISRAGANTLAEIAIMGKPSILIPLPTAAGDHQTKNALVFQKEKAALLLKESELSPVILFEKIKKLIQNKKLLRKMGKNAKKLGQPDAASKIVKEMLRIAEKY